MTSDDYTTAETKRYAERLYAVRNLVVWHGPFCPDGSAILDIAGGVMWIDRKECVPMMVDVPRLSDWCAAVDRLLRDQYPLQDVRIWAEDLWPGIELEWLPPPPTEMDMAGHIRIRLAQREGTEVVSCMVPPTTETLQWSIRRAVERAR